MTTVRELYGNFLLPLIDIVYKISKKDDDIKNTEILNKIGDMKCSELHKYPTLSQQNEAHKNILDTVTKILEHTSGNNCTCDYNLTYNKIWKLSRKLEHYMSHIDPKCKTSNLNVSDFITQYISQYKNIFDHYFDVDGINFESEEIHIPKRIYKLIKRLKQIDDIVAGDIIDMLIKQTIRNHNSEKTNERYCNDIPIFNELIDTSNDNYGFMSSLKKYYMMKHLRFHQSNINYNQIHKICEIVSKISDSMYKKLSDVILNVIPNMTNAKTTLHLFHGIHGEPDIVYDDKCIEIKCIKRCDNAINLYKLRTEFQLIMYSSLLMHKGIKINELVIFDINNGLIHRANVRDITEEMYMKFIPDVFGRYPSKK